MIKKRFSLIFYREGRRASDGLVAQGIQSQTDYVPNSAVAFNSQRLHEACKTKGVLELHLLQKEATQLKTQYQSNVPPDEMNVRQIQHSQFHINPINKNGVGVGGTSIDNYSTQIYGSGGGGGGGGVGISTNGCLTNISGISNCMTGKPSMCDYTKVCGGDLSTFVGLFRNELIGGKNTADALRDLKLEQLQQAVQSTQLQKPPLQQQLMQHRLLQQKRQILQKQVAMETGLSRRQMLRQQSYKIAQQQQILPPLPLNELENEDLLAFQAIVEGPSSSLSLACAQSSIITSSNTNVTSGNCGLINGGSPKLMKTSHISSQNSLSNNTTDCWSTLPNSMQTCQISENALAPENWTHPSLYQVYFVNK